MADDLDMIVARAEASMGMVRNLVESWVPKEKNVKKPPPKQDLDKLATTMYSVDAKAARQKSVLQKRILGQNQGPAVGTSSRPGERAGKTALATGRTSSKDLSTHQQKGSIDSDDEDTLLRKTASSSKIIKKPTDVLSSYLVRSGSKKKKKPKTQPVSEG
ncbi:hypothetical protein BC832DRAFT_589877 [Gaertneriomyces semiglobifer]|nr:hypothetical protein BC832DRAFT_589877 [Gaertneriomyces semiglobifer]